MDEINSLLTNVWDRIKYSTEENFRYQIEGAMMAAGFVGRVKEAQNQQNIVGEEQTPAHDAVGGEINRNLVPLPPVHRGNGHRPKKVRASQFLSPKTQGLIQFKQDENRVEAKREEVRAALEPAAAASLGVAASLGTTVPAGPMPKASDILRDLKDQLETKETLEF